jgi:hypothetical protein
MEFITDFEHYNRIRRSVKDHGCSLSDILDDSDVFEHDGLYYNSDDWVVTREDNAEWREDVHYCNYYEEYTSEDVSRVYIGREECYYSESAINRCGELYYYDGDYYDCDALSRHDLVVMPDGDVEPINEVYYWDSDGEYHYEPENRYTRSYHNGGSRTKRFTDEPKFYIGFEIEKEDQAVKESICINDFEDETNNEWRKEDDGSLNDDSGYELISPTYELLPDKIFEDIESNSLIVKHINAGFSKERCGGHINVSQDGLTGMELFDKVKGYTPLFYALYYGRVDNSYCRGKKINDLKEHNEKRQAIRIHYNRIEYRIVSAVPNVSVLKWRTRLIEFIVNNPTDSPETAFYNIMTSLKPLLTEVYDTDERFQKLLERVIKYTLDFENITLINPNTNQ